MGIYKTNEDGNDEYVAGISDGEEDKGYSFRLPKGEYKFRFTAPKYYDNKELNRKIPIIMKQKRITVLNMPIK